MTGKRKKGNVNPRVTMWRQLLGHDIALEIVAEAYKDIEKGIDWDECEDTARRGAETDGAHGIITPCSRAARLEAGP